MNNINRLIKLSYLIFGIVILNSCTADFLEPTVPLDKSIALNINTPEDINGLVLGAYERMRQTGYYGRDAVVHGSVRSDNGYSNGNSRRFIYSAQFNYQSNSGDPLYMWNDIYETIASTNIVINSTIDKEYLPEVKHIKGEAYAIRAIAHMDLLKFFGQQWAGGTMGIPYIKGYMENLTPSRNTIDEVWSYIEQDLNMASSLMSETFNEGPTRITTYGVAAIKARYYLYTEQWNNLITEAEYIINSGEFDLPIPSTLANTYIGSGGTTSIFELAFSRKDNVGLNGLYQIYNTTDYGDAVCTINLYNSYEFGDARKRLIAWDPIKRAYRMVGKYPSSTYDDNVRVVRYAEVILNYAEALLQSGNVPKALTELNKITAAAGASPYLVNVSLDDILLERRKELAMEGFRFFDLMRNGLDVLKVDPNQNFDGTKVSPGETRVAFPIPDAEMNANSNMVQNDGY